jgi:hypothetical protein
MHADHPEQQDQVYETMNLILVYSDLTLHAFPITICICDRSCVRTWDPSKSFHAQSKLLGIMVARTRCSVQPCHRCLRIMHSVPLTILLWRSSCHHQQLPANTYLSSASRVILYTNGCVTVGTFDVCLMDDHGLGATSFSSNSQSSIGLVFIQGSAPLLHYCGVNTRSVVKRRNGNIMRRLSVRPATSLPSNMA